MPNLIKKSWTVSNRYFLQDSVKIIETKMISLAHFVLTALHMVQMTLAYFLMLIVMTYNTWLCLSVIFGSTLGYFLFGWRKTTVVDVSDHCHWHQLLWDVHVPKLHPIFLQKHRLFSKFFKTEKSVYSKIKVVWSSYLANFCIHKCAVPKDSMQKCQSWIW